ncbi:peroxiredoxin family protein [Nitrospina sp. 32_T5]|uniref:peroxiredoxin family protein n=2 Tax=Nitrospina TaxID=35800 RepID=UPI003F94989C
MNDRTQKKKMEHVLEKKPVSVYIPYSLLAAALLFIFLKALDNVPPKPFETEYPAEAFLAPNFELPTLNGGKISLKDYRGKVVFINFWATWCATCKVEMPSMQKVYDKFKDRGFEMLTISVDKDQKLIQPFMEEYNLTFPVLLDPDEEIAKQVYKTTGVPETFIVSKNGVIVHKAIGPRDWATEDAMAAFQQLVEQS